MIRAIVLGCYLLTFSAGLAWAAETIGDAFAISGSVTGTTSSGPTRVLSRGSDVHFKESIRARAASSGQFHFIDGSRLVVGEGSEVVLDEFVFRGGAARVRLNMTKGALRFLGAGTRPGRDDVSITTPVAIVGIRGTVVDVTHAAGRTAFLLLHGSAEVCRRGGACQLVTEPCTSVLVEGDVSDIMQRDAAALAADFPLLAGQARLWPDYRAASTCGVSPAAQPVDRARGRSDGGGGGLGNGNGGNGGGTAGKD
ncbi:FecR family protein [Breoghania corrubedonensis]|uniref:FecR family protein n=1 Tax=Breoghania corrubedonensis TaxID=665038 RepID=A0A2T5VFR1_9HYPH|nr:FecR domain-containing protein [Breoghania corrubedonensis]PTW62597.1 FecR family protein [Breoghania corrubedonensis]